MLKKNYKRHAKMINSVNRVDWTEFENESKTQIVDNLKKKSEIWELLTEKEKKNLER